MYYSEADYDADRCDSRATEADAHREWHRNTGTSMTRPEYPGCPWDCLAGWEPDLADELHYQVRQSLITQAEADQTLAVDYAMRRAYNIVLTRRQAADDIELSTAPF